MTCPRITWFVHVRLSAAVGIYTPSYSPPLKAMSTSFPNSGSSTPTFVPRHLATKPKPTPATSSPSGSTRNVGVPSSSGAGMAVNRGSAYDEGNRGALYNGEEEGERGGDGALKSMQVESSGWDPGSSLLLLRFIVKGNTNKILLYSSVHPPLFLFLLVLSSPCSSCSS